MKKPGQRYTVAVDFDGVLHSYTSPWVNARTIPDPPVEGAIQWLADIVTRFDVAITSTRNSQWFGRWAMKSWLREHLWQFMWPKANEAVSGWTHGDVDEWAGRLADEVLSHVSFPRHKPPALVYLDDRALRFDGPGSWPTPDQIHAARPWNKVSR